MNNSFRCISISENVLELFILDPISKEPVTECYFDMAPGQSITGCKLKGLKMTKMSAGQCACPVKFMSQEKNCTLLNITVRLPFCTFSLP